MLPKKIVPKVVVNDAQASSHDNGELISSKYQDETEEASSRPSKIQVDIFSQWWQHPNSEALKSDNETNKSEVKNLKVSELNK